MHCGEHGGILFFYIVRLEWRLALMVHLRPWEDKYNGAVNK